MQLLFCITVVLAGLVINYQCAPAGESTGVLASSSAQSPEYSVNSELHEGDIVRHPLANGVQGRGVAIRPAYARWTGGVVPYEFSANLSSNDTAFVVQQMRAIESLTMVNSVQCVRFRPKNASDQYFITIFNGSGCSAPVGSWGNYVGVRPVSLLSGWFSTCMISGIVQHELTHVLGLYHEQSRPDRDSYVNIVWANIDPATVSNFVKYNDSDVDTQMTPYDYGSVMHYERNAFALNASGPTIIPIMNATAFIGQRVQLSPIDILEIQRYYGCVPTPTSTVTTTGSSSTSSSSSTGSSSTSTVTTTRSSSTTSSSSNGSSSTSTVTTTRSSSTSSLSSNASSSTTRTSTASSSSGGSSSSSATASATARNAGVRNAFQMHAGISAISFTFALYLINSIH